MAKYHKAWARRRRALLIEVLGSKCALQHKGDCRGALQVDCIIPQGDGHHRMDTSARQSFYHEQLRQHNLQLLCERHQALKSRRERGRKAQELNAISSMIKKEDNVPVDNIPF